MMIGEIKGKVCVGIYDLKFNLYMFFNLWSALSFWNYVWRLDHMHSFDE